jgi:hypothetical protein
VKIILFILLLTINGCSILQVQKAEELAKKTYRKSLKFEVEEKIYEGIAVLSYKNCHNITFRPEDKMTFFIFQTPHRDEPMEKPKTGWFSNKVEYKFCPQLGIEDQGYSPLEVAALNEKQKFDSFAFIVFRDIRPEISLTANLKCNGKFKTYDGTSVCQTAEGLMQQIYFNQQVITSEPNAGCFKPESKDGIFWNIKVSEGECPYYFTAREKHKNGKRLSHLLTTIGYTALGGQN